MYAGLGLTTQGEAQGFFEKVLKKRWDLYLHGSPKVFQGIKKGLWDLHSQGGPKVLEKR